MTGAPPNDQWKFPILCGDVNWKQSSLPHPSRRRLNPVSGRGLPRRHHLGAHKAAPALILGQGSKLNALAPVAPILVLVAFDASDGSTVQVSLSQLALPD